MIDNGQQKRDNNWEQNSIVPDVIDQKRNELSIKQDSIIDDIIEAPTKEDLEKQFALFNMAQVKKNALRITKLNTILEKAEDQALTRLEKRPDMISNKELIDYINVASTQLERANNFNTETLSAENGGIRIKSKQTQVNINVAPTLTKENKERVANLMATLLKQVGNAPDSTEVSIVEAEELNTKAEEAEVVEINNTESEIK